MIYVADPSDEDKLSRNSDCDQELGQEINTKLKLYQIYVLNPKWKFVEIN